MAVQPDGGVEASTDDATAAQQAAPAAKPAAPMQQDGPGPAPVPTQDGPHGIRFDFNLGARVTVPEGAFRVILRDLDTGNVLFDQETGGAFISSAKRYFVRFRIEVMRAGDLVFGHDYRCADREVLIQFPVGTLGDTMGWIRYAIRFGEVHGCRLTIAMGAKLAELFRAAYPDVTFVTPEAVEPGRYYATYRIGLFFDDKENIWQPCDFRSVGLHKTAGYILGVDIAEDAPRMAIPSGRPIPEPYVCIGVQSTSQAKYWNNPDGWRAVIAHLKARGYRVVCIDQKPVHGHGIVYTHIPHGAEDQTGHSLPETARWLRHAAFYVGLSSGLSWLAWGARCPVVMISGFSHPTTEFSTPYRVINYHTCNSCWNDPKERFDHGDFLWCPRQKNTPRQFECTRLITPVFVIAAVDRAIRDTGGAPVDITPDITPDTAAAPAVPIRFVSPVALAARQDSAA